MADYAKQSQFPGPQLARQPMASGDARPAARQSQFMGRLPKKQKVDVRNKANSETCPAGMENVPCRTKPISRGRQVEARTCCAKQSQFAGTPDEG
jgi:hypothetical protein